MEDFQYYRNNRANSWVSDGKLHIMPTPTALEYGEDFLYSGTIDLFSEDPEHPCNIGWSQDTLCRDSAGADIDGHSSPHDTHPGAGGGSHKIMS